MPSLDTQKSIEHFQLLTWSFLIFSTRFHFSIVQFFPLSAVLIHSLASSRHSSSSRKKITRRKKSNWSHFMFDFISYCRMKKFFFTNELNSDGGSIFNFFLLGHPFEFFPFHQQTQKCLKFDYFPPPCSLFKDEDFFGSEHDFLSSCLHMDGYLDG